MPIPLSHANIRDAPRGQLSHFGMVRHLPGIPPKLYYEADECFIPNGCGVALVPSAKFL